MSINITAKTNYSFLFNSLGNSNRNSSLGNLNFLSDYASIKNGSYGKLMKAYFNQTSGDEATSLAKKSTEKLSNTTSKDDTKTLAKVQESSDALKESADVLLAKGKDAVFSKDEVTAKAYNAVSAFVDDYNAVLKATDTVNSTSILNKAIGMVNVTTANEKLLSKVGITVGNDNSLTLDKETFMKADAATVSNLFQTTGGYAYRISAQSSLINFAADNEAAKANTYNFTGAYSNNYSAGNIFNSFF